MYAALDIFGIFCYANTLKIWRTPFLKPLIVQRKFLLSLGGWSGSRIGVGGACRRTVSVLSKFPPSIALLRWMINPNQPAPLAGHSTNAP